MKQVTRTIETHVITPAKVELVEGQVVTTPLAPITIMNQGVNNEKAMRLTQKEYGRKDQYVILSIETSSKTYGIDFDKFMELAVIVEKK